MPRTDVALSRQIRNLLKEDDLPSLDQETLQEWALTEQFRLVSSFVHVCPYQSLEDLELHREVTSALNKLSPREERVLRMLMGLGIREMEHDQIGALLGVSAERVRQIEAKAIRKLKHPRRSRTLRSFLWDWEPAN